MATRDYVDPRDSKVYPCAQMPDGKWWFTKNLAYTGKGYDYNDDSSNRAVYGRLYLYTDLQSICPIGCHIPTDAEWTALITAAGGTGQSDPAGTNLKAISSLWDTNSGSDLYGFSALPAGYRNGTEAEGSYTLLGKNATFWSSTVNNSDTPDAWSVYATFDHIYMSRVADFQFRGMSVRCIVDSFPIIYKNFTDSRDGTVYPCVQMPDGKWWSSKNLAYITAASYAGSNSGYGRYYSRSEVETVIPSNCHLPTYDEGEALKSALGSSPGKKLKASSDLWNSNTGTDDYGFALLPAGEGYLKDGNFSNTEEGNVGYFSVVPRDETVLRCYATASHDDLGFAYGVSNYCVPIRFIVDDFNPGIDPGTDPTTGEKRLPDDGVTFTPIAAPVAFTPFTKRIRKIHSLGGIAFSSTFKYTYTSDELTKVLSNFISAPVGVIKYSDFPIGLAAVAAYITGNRTMEPLTRGATLSLPVKVILDSPTAKYPTVTLASGELPVCPIPLRPVEGISEAATEIVENLVDPYAGIVATASRGTDLSFTVGMSTDEMAQFISWWWKILDCGRRKFVTSLYDMNGCLFNLTSAPSFSLSGCVGQVKLSGEVRDLKRTISISGFTVNTSGNLVVTVDDLSADSKAILISDDGTVMSQSNFWLVWSSATSGELHSSGLSAGNYHWCIFGGGKISTWHSMKVS